MITSQLGFSAVSVSLSSLARASPSCRFMFIFQLPATIFFLIVVSFLFVIIWVVLFLLFLRRLTHFVHIHVRSAKERSASGSTNQSSSRVIFPGTESCGICPISLCSSGIDSRSGSICGRLLWLHLRITVPALSSNRPGLLRMMVFSVISSV